MPSWKTLWAQRLRWQRGALENLGAYGVLPQTFRYWAQQLGIGYGVVALFGYALLILVTLLALDHWVWFPFWMGIGGLFTAERGGHGLEGRLAGTAAGDHAAEMSRTPLTKTRLRNA